MAAERERAEFSRIYGARGDVRRRSAILQSSSGWNRFLPVLQRVPDRSRRALQPVDTHPIPAVEARTVGRVQLALRQRTGSGATPCFAATATCTATTQPADPVLNNNTDTVLLNNTITGLPLTADQEYQAGSRAMACPSCPAHCSATSMLLAQQVSLDHASSRCRDPTGK